MTKRKLTDAQRKAMYAKANGRPYQAMNRDQSVTAQRTLPDTPENREVWASNPRRYDLVGVDDKRTVKGGGINNIKTISRLPKGEGGKSTMGHTEDEQKIDKINANGYTGLAAAQIESVNRMIRRHNNHIDKHGMDGWEHVTKDSIEKERNEINKTMPKVRKTMDEQKTSETNVDPLRVKINELEREHSRVQTKKNEHQYTKVSTENERTQKRKVQAHYDKELVDIRTKLEHLEAAL